MPQIQESATFINGALVTTGSAQSTTGGATPVSYQSAATTNATSVKAAPGTVFSIEVFNTTSSNKYVRFFDKASAPTVGTDVPVKRILLPPNGGDISHYPAGQSYLLGIAFCITGSFLDSDTTVVAVGDVFVNIGYK
jgi:hypothetical protein